MSASDCISSEPRPLIPTDEAISILLSHARPLAEQDMVATSDGLGRVLAKPVKSLVNVPPWHNSAMDGYAFSAEQIQVATPYPVSQRIPAGTAGQPLAEGTLARIFTGAPMPAGADTVVMQEHCTVSEDGRVSIQQLPSAGANVRHTGEDIAAGNDILAAGTLLAPQHLGLAASVGVAELAVYRRLRVAVFASGDELVQPGETLAPGQIYNSNQFTLTGLLQTLGCEVINLGRVEDTLEATCEALSAGAAQADLVIASGGVSVGEEDHVKPAVEKLGSLEMWKIAMRPGKPLAFGHINDTPFIGTPGNPVSLFVTFVIFARPFIKQMQGMTGSLYPPMIRVKADFDWTRPDRRREYARAQLATDHRGQSVVSLYPSRSSGVLSSVAWANGLVMFEPEQVVQRGEEVFFIPFAELLS